MHRLPHRSAARALSALPALALLLAPVGGAWAAAKEACAPAEQGEPLSVALVTSSSGALIFNSMGHTALWFSGGPLQEGEVYNWGAYDGMRADLGPAFLRGEMNFWLADEVWPVQWRRNVRQQRSVVVQRLDVPEAAALALLEELQVTVRPENREYRYHWANANCATRARDAIDRLIGGQLATALDYPVPHTARFEGARHLSRHPVVAFAWDFMAGPYVDQPLSAYALGMVPERLMDLVQPVRWTDGNGVNHDLVIERCTLREGEYSWARPEPLPAWPVALFTAAGAALLLALGEAGRQRRAARRVAGLMLGLWGLGAGLLGLVTFVLWGISELDGVGPTASWTVANPLTLALVGAGVKLWRGQTDGRWLGTITAGLAALGGMGLLLSPLIPQDYLHMVAVFWPPLLAAAALWRGAWRPGPPAA